jgi:UDP-sulfoquinovose synthase
METFSTPELAERVQGVGGQKGYDVKIEYIKNRRKEAEDHYYNATYRGLIDLDVKPHYLTDDILSDMFDVVEKYRDNIRKEVISRGIKW